MERLILTYNEMGYKIELYGFIYDHCSIIGLNPQDFTTPSQLLVSVASFQDFLFANQILSQSCPEHPGRGGIGA